MHGQKVHACYGKVGTCMKARFIYSHHTLHPLSERNVWLHVHAFEGKSSVEKDKYLSPGSL